MTADGFPVIRGIADIEAFEKKPFDEFVTAASIYDLIAQAAQSYGRKTAFYYMPDGLPETVASEISYAELLKRVTQAANLFRSVGVESEDSVAILAPNIPEAQFALWGAETAARANPINFMLDVDHIVEIIKQAKAKVIVALGPDGELPIFDKLQEIVKATGIDQVYILDEKNDHGGYESFMSALDRLDGSQLAFSHELKHSSIAALFHTGGTTGVPKLAQHLHGNQLFTSYCAALYYQLSGDDVVINGFPMFHVAGTFVYGTSCFTVGATQVLTTRTGYRNKALMENIWAHVERFGVTIFACVPTVMTTLVQTDAGGSDLSKLRAFYTGGSPLPTELADAVESKLSVAVRNIFGMTECAGLLSLEPFGAPRTPGSAGYRLPYSEIQAFPTGEGGAVDLSRPCDPGDVGVLAIRGPNVTPGYTDSSRNPGTFEQGWLVSGDLGTVDDQGRVFVTGREKDVIIRGAHNIDPASIEEAVDRHPAISICAAIGQPDVYAGEIPVVFAELKEGMTATSEEVLAVANPLIPEPAARPKRVVFVDELPKTAVGKIFKPALRCRAAEYAFVQSLAETGFVGQVEAVLDDGRVSVILYIDAGVTKEEVEGYRKVLQNYVVPYRFVQR